MGSLRQTCLLKRIPVGNSIKKYRKYQSWTVLNNNSWKRENFWCQSSISSMRPGCNLISHPFLRLYWIPHIKDFNDAWSCTKPCWGLPLACNRKPDLNAISLVSWTSKRQNLTTGYGQKITFVWILYITLQLFMSNEPLVQAEPDILRSCLLSTKSFFTGS